LLRWIGWSIAGVLAALVVATIATLRFGDSAIYPPSAGSPRVDVFVAANLYHSGIILPREAIAAAAQRRNLPALAMIAKRFAEFPWVEFGWGDEGFYTRVPTTRELTTALALRALLRPGNPSVLHVAGLAEHPRQAFPEASMVRLALGEPGFDRLSALLDASFVRDRGGIVELGPGLYGQSLFYRAAGTFNLLRVCNHWIADLLDAAGVPTAPVLATMPQGLLWDLSTRAGAERLPPVRTGGSRSEGH
jgi:uncharacterized protein (TIGR02117 family)